MEPWRTDTVAALIARLEAQDYYAERDSTCGILADALEDAGYPDPNLLERLRAKNHHVHEYYRFIGILKSSETAEMVRWIDAFADELDQTWNRLFDAATQWYHSREYTYDNSETYKEVNYGKWPTFWEYWATLTGTTLNTKTHPDEPSYMDFSPDQHPFTCSC